MKITKLFDRLNAGEHASRALRITLEEELRALTARLVFLTPEGKRYVIKYHNIQDRRIRQLHHDAVRKLEHHNI